MNGIVGFGTYVPYSRLERTAIGEALGKGGPGGQRAVASYDEDATTMAVEAARHLLRAVPEAASASSLVFATASPPYLDKTNATAVHAALGLDDALPAFDAMGSVRSGCGAVRQALTSTETTLVAIGDVRTGLPGSADEREGGDAGVALLVGPGTGAPVIAEYVGGASASREFLDRWRVPGAGFSRVWEERFGEHEYVPLGARALGDALKHAGVDAAGVDHLVVTGTHARAARGVAARSGVPVGRADDLASTVGNTGTAHPWLLLANVLEQAAPGQVVAVVVLADGADAFVFRTTDALASFRPAATVAEQVASGRADLPYARFLAWRGFLDEEPPRRPDPVPPASPVAARNEEWKFGFTASRCQECGYRHLPPTRVCANCGAVDHMDGERLADVPATVATFTVDRLAYTPSPPLVAAVVDFDGGGRFRCEITDVDPDRVAIGDRLEMTFRRTHTANGVHNYFWKARPVRRAAH